MSTYDLSLIFFHNLVFLSFFFFVLPFLFSLSLLNLFIALSVTSKEVFNYSQITVLPPLYFELICPFRFSLGRIRKMKILFLTVIVLYCHQTLGKKLKDLQKHDCPFVAADRISLLSFEVPYVTRKR